MYAFVKTFLSNLIFGKVSQADIAAVHDQFRQREAAEGKEKVHGGR